LCVSCCSVLYFVQRCVREHMVGCVSAVVVCCILYSGVCVNVWLVVSPVAMWCILYSGVYVNRWLVVSAVVV
jgi:hypothetical protein